MSKRPKHAPRTSSDVAMDRIAAEDAAGALGPTCVHCTRTIDPVAIPGTLHAHAEVCPANVHTHAEWLRHTSSMRGM